MNFARCTLGLAFCLAAAIPAAEAADEVAGMDLLNRTRAKIVENVRRLPRYTCTQTLRRFRFRADQPAQAPICTEGLDSAYQAGLPLNWSDQLKLDVTVARGEEIFSWAGTRQTTGQPVEALTGGGMSGTGDFGPFQMSIFAANGSMYQYTGQEKREGQLLAVYRYRVPLSVSHYQINVTGGGLETMAYEGRLWIDPKTAELRRMTIEVPQPPQESMVCRVETEIDYHRSPIGGYEFLLPQLTVLRMWDSTGERHENRIDYSDCHEFQAESVFRTDLDAVSPGARAPSNPVAIPADLTVKIALQTRIDSATGFAGDPVDGKLSAPVKDSHGKILLPRGAAVYGRIVRFERQYRPANYFVIGLKFDSVDRNGSADPLRLRPAHVPAEVEFLTDPADQAQGVGLFVIHKSHASLNKGFVSEWKTETVPETNLNKPESKKPDSNR